MTPSAIAQAVHRDGRTRILDPDDAGRDDSRQASNRAADQRPALIPCPRPPADVADALALAFDRCLRLAPHAPAHVPNPPALRAAPPARRAPPQARHPRVLAVPRHATSEELVVAAGRGDANAFAELSHRFLRPVLSEALRMIGDRPTAEDVAQDVFVAIWRAAARFEPASGSAAAWILSITRNRARDVLRRRRPVVSQELDDIPDTGDGTEQLVVESVEAFAIAAAVASLPPDERAVVQLAYWQGLSQSEIAERTGLPLGTVKTRTRRALRRLARPLAGQRA